MKAIARSRYGSSDVLELVDVPKPEPGGGDVLVRVHASSVNMADVDYMLGRPRIARLGTGPQAPRHPGLGLDVAGVVEAVGAEVTRFDVGDAVIGDLTNFGFGAFAEYACAPERAFAPKPPELSFVQAAAVPQAAIMALQGLGRGRRIRSGDSVLVNGAGGTVGPFAVQIAKALGAEVTGVDAPEKMELIRTLGADHALEYTAVDYTRMGVRYDWIFDLAPFHPFRRVRRALSPRGVYVMVPATVGQTFKGFVVAPLLSLMGGRKLRVVPWKPMDQGDVTFLSELLSTGRVVPHIDRSYRLSDVPAAMSFVDAGHARGKVVIAM